MAPNTCQCPEGYSGVSCEDCELLVAIIACSTDMYSLLYNDMCDRASSR